MPKRRVSLADLHRTAVGQGQALLGTVPAEAPRALGGFDTHGISQHTHPTVADISECLFFSPGDWRIWLQDQRMILLHSEALGSLRRERGRGAGARGRAGPAPPPPPPPPGGAGAGAAGPRGGGGAPPPDPGK